MNFTLNLSSHFSAFLSRSRVGGGGGARVRILRLCDSNLLAAEKFPGTFHPTNFNTLILSL